MPQTPLSALIITHRGGALLARGLAALRPQLGPLDTLHVAVSNVPGAADLSACAAFGAEVLHLGENVGFAKAANLGLAACARALILLLNDDTAPLPGFIDALRAAAAARPGLYQPRILLSDGSGRLDNTGHGLFPDGFNWARGREDHDSPAYDLPGEVGACSGAALLVHRDVLDAIGPFDEDLEAFGEDVDLSLRARRRGFPLIYVPEARIVHDLGATYGRYTPRKVFLVERTGSGRCGATCSSTGFGCGTCCDEGRRDRRAQRTRHLARRARGLAAGPAHLRRGRRQRAAAHRARRGDALAPQQEPRLRRGPAHGLSGGLGGGGHPHRPGSWRRPVRRGRRVGALGRLGRRGRGLGLTVSGGGRRRGDPVLAAPGQPRAHGVCAAAAGH
ncbi:MAG: glycosyltransferase family 2 protein [Deltaproteobacteria bacterium]|nr:glycosyltransferase family 2 protein [Deltaproteobacteria bacterium]